jgi:hypothetical protein
MYRLKMLQLSGKLIIAQIFNEPIAAIAPRSK